MFVNCVWISKVPLRFENYDRAFFHRAQTNGKCKISIKLLTNVIKKMIYSLFYKKLRDFEIISVSSLFRFNYNIINLLFLKSYFIINSAYLNAQIIWNDMKNEIKYRRRNVSFISLYFFFFFFISNLTDYNIVSWKKKRKRYWNWCNKLLNEFIINITI